MFARRPSRNYASISGMAVSIILKKDEEIDRLRREVELLTDKVELLEGTVPIDPVTMKKDPKELKPPLEEHLKMLKFLGLEPSPSAPNPVLHHRKLR